jgi:plasmid stabilization system protein ParE
MNPKKLYQRWQERRRERLAEQYGHLSAAERAEVERLRDQHDPLGEMARSGTPPPFRDEPR